MKQYLVNEVFYSLQGEGVRAGTPNLFLRFARCNLTCAQETHGFDCDTEFVSGRRLGVEEIVSELRGGGRRAREQRSGDCQARSPSRYARDGQRS